MIHIKTYSTLVICSITILNAQVEGMEVHVNVWKYEFLLNQLPDYPLNKHIKTFDMCLSGETQASSVITAHPNYYKWLS